MDSDRLAALHAATGLAPSLSFGMPVFTLEAAGVPALVERLREQAGFDMLLDLTAVDWPGRTLRFDVVWHFWSSSSLMRVRVKAAVSEASPEVPSLVAWYGSAAYMERECHEMFGIRFAGNADLRPILLYEGFVGHPLRKDYDKRHEQPLVHYRDGGGA